MNLQPFELSQYAKDNNGISHSINGQQLYWIPGQVFAMTQEQIESNLFWYGHF